MGIACEICGVPVISPASVPAEYDCSFSGMPFGKVIVDPVGPHLTVETGHTARPASSINPPEIDSLVNERVVQDIHKGLRLEPLGQVKFDSLSRRSVCERNRLQYDSPATAPVIHPQSDQYAIAGFDIRRNISKRGRIIDAVSRGTVMCDLLTVDKQVVFIIDPAEYEINLAGKRRRKNN